MNYLCQNRDLSVFSSKTKYGNKVEYVGINLSITTK